MRRGILFSCFVIFISMPLSSPMAAQESRIHVGNLKIVPGLVINTTYDDNIYLGNGTNSNTELKESDRINHFKPKLDFNYSLPERGSLLFGYEADLAYYNDNSLNDWQTHKATLRLSYISPRAFIIDIGSNYIISEDPYGSVEQYRIGLKTKRWSKDLKVKAGRNFGNIFKILTYYNYYKQDYHLERDYSQDYYANELGIGFRSRLLPKTWGFFRYYYGKRDYFTHPYGTGATESNDSDFDWHMVSFGLTWDPGAKLKGEINLGYKWRDYQNVADLEGNKYDEKNTWITLTQVSFRATPATALAVSITKALRDRGSNTSEYFEDFGMGINFQKALLRKLTLSVSGIYSINSYNLPITRPREDENYKADIGLDYQIKDWLTAAIGYIYREKDSNYKENEYTNNQFMISLIAKY